MSRSPTDEFILRAIGLNLRSLRGQAKLTQEELAELSGLSRNYYNEVENGSRNISLTNLCKIIFALDLDDTNKLIDKSDLKSRLVGQYE